MSDEPSPRNPIEVPWQPIAVVCADKVPTKPPRTRLWSPECGLMLVTLVLGAQDSWTAYTFLMRAEPPERTLSKAIYGLVFLLIGSVLLGYQLGIWIAALRQRRSRN